MQPDQRDSREQYDVSLGATQVRIWHMVNNASESKAVGICATFLSSRNLGERAEVGILQKPHSLAAFVTFGVGDGISIDTFIYSLFVPILPFTLAQGLHLPTDTVQIWSYTMLGCFGSAILAGSRKQGFLTRNELEELVW